MVQKCTSSIFLQLTRSKSWMCGRRKFSISIDNFLKLLWDGYQFEPEYKHDIFSDYTDQCFAGSEPHVIECCGEYPKRKPFFADGDFECCNNVTLFNTNKALCCDDGRVALDCYI